MGPRPSMRATCLAVAALLIMGLAGAGHAASRPRPQVNWMLVRVTAGDHPARDPSLIVNQKVFATSRIHAYGSGVAFRGSNLLTVTPTSTGAGAVSTSHTLGGVSLTAPNPLQGPHGELGLFWFLPQTLRPRESGEALIFFAGGYFDGPPAIRTKTKSGHVHAQVLVEGAGATGWWLADPNDDGPAVAVSYAGAGSVRHTADTTAGIAGAFAEDFDLASASVFQANWHGPRHHAGTTSSTCAPALTCHEAGMNFAGPAGRWSWNWTGATVTQHSTVLAAWAPIGEYWRSFAPPGQ